ncbi:MAG TPA: ABC transporter ATP-binding protein [Caulifigura sp.]|nr:ABC transporter ATP-binding protein [Caulifigura sp.]
MDSPLSVIHLNKIVKDYGHYRALDSVTCDIGQGVTGLLGPNGAGKSTLIKVLLGLVRVTSGTGEVLGIPLGSDFRATRARIGYMAEDDCYIPGLTGVEMVQFAARLSGIPKIEALRRAHEILDFCGAEQERYREVDGYSTGMRQKLKFAQAIVHDPDLLILDEPTAGLDPEEREQMLSRIQVLSQRAGKAVLVSTHILPDVREVCDNAVILVKGQVRLVQSLDILKKPSAPVYHIRFSGEHAAFLDRARRGGIRSSVEENGVVTLDGLDAGNVHLVWDWARETNTGVRSLTPTRNTLEQMFMDAVRDAGDAGSR